MPQFKTSKLELVQLDPPPGFWLATPMSFTQFCTHDVDLSTTSSYAPCGLLGCGGVKTASLKGKFTHHNLDNSLNHYIIQSANNCKWALLLLATRSTLLYSISELCCVVLCATLASYTRMPGPGEWPALVHCGLSLASLNEWREGIMMWIYPQHPHMHHVGCLVVVAWIPLRWRENLRTTILIIHWITISFNCANNCKWALLLLATRSTLLYSISEYVALSYALHTYPVKSFTFVNNNKLSKMSRPRQLLGIHDVCCFT